MKNILQSENQDTVCPYCHKRLNSEKGKIVHISKKHGLYKDEYIKVEEIDKDHVQLTIKMRRTLYDVMMQTVESAKIDFYKYILEVLPEGELYEHEESEKQICQIHYVA